MPIHPVLVERVMLKAGAFPAPLLDGFIYWMASKALLVANDLGVFDALEMGALSASELAEAVEASEKGVRVLLEVLDSLGYVTCSDGRYANTKMASRWLARRSPDTLAHSLTFFHEFWQRAEYTEEAIRRGAPPISAWEWMAQRPGTYRHAQLHWRSLARMGGKEIVSKVKLPAGARRLLDLGGGHGLYAIQFCRSYPELSAVIFDWAEGIDMAEETIAEEGMGDRVGVQVGDFFSDDIGDGYDVVLMFNLIHSNSGVENTALLEKVFHALNPNGLVVIYDAILDKRSSGISGVLASLLGLNLLVEGGGQAYHFEDVSGWLAQAGFVDHRRIRLMRARGFALILGTKPPAD